MLVLAACYLLGGFSNFVFRFYILQQDAEPNAQAESQGLTMTAQSRALRLSNPKFQHIWKVGRDLWKGQEAKRGLPFGFLRQGMTFYVVQTNHKLDDSPVSASWVLA